MTLPKGTVTWEAQNSFSTIDLVFRSEFLAERLEHCMSRPEINQSSDHIPISTRILLGSEQLTKVKRRAWKLLNMEKLREAESNAPPVTHPRSTAEIDQYAQTIQELLQKIITASVPWARPSEYAKPFWNEECNRATRETRKLHRFWSSSRHLDDWKAYMKSNDKKQKDNPKSKNALISQRDKKSNRVAVGHMEASKMGKRKESEAPRDTENAAIEARRANSGDVRRKSGNAESQILSPPPAGRLERHTRAVLPRRRGLPHDNHK